MSDRTNPPDPETRRRSKIGLAWAGIILAILLLARGAWMLTVDASDVGTWLWPIITGACLGPLFISTIRRLRRPRQ